MQQGWSAGNVPAQTACFDRSSVQHYLWKCDITCDLGIVSRNGTAERGFEYLKAKKLE